MTAPAAWQVNMATALTKSSSLRTAIRSNTARRAAVLVTVCTVAERGPNRPHLLFTKRSGRVGTHKHQVSFPGGRTEAAETAVQTALRETHEEIGIAPQDVTVLGELNDLFAVTREVVTPVVGVLNAPLPLHAHASAIDFSGRFAPLRVSENEIDDVMLIPIDQLTDARLLDWSDLGFGVGLVPVFRAGRHDVWGLTAMITRTFLQTIGQWNVDQPAKGSLRSRGE